MAFPARGSSKTLLKGDTMKGLFLSISAVAVFFLFMPVCHADSTAVNGYRIDLQVTNTSMGQLHALGRIDGGEPCKKLRVSITAQNENNNIAAISAIVDDVGSGGGRVINATQRSYSKGIIWKVVKVGTSCLQKN
jgi:hypothetical protein